MSWIRHSSPHHGGSAPATPGFSAVAPEWQPGCGAAKNAAPAIPAAESTLGSHPCVALSSAQVFPEWTTATSSCNTFAANGDNPLNFVSHSRGSLQRMLVPPLLRIVRQVDARGGLLRHGEAERESDLHLRDHFHGPSVQQRGSILPLAHCRAGSFH